MADILTRKNVERALEHHGCFKVIDLKVFLGNRVLASRIQFRRHLSPISGEDVVERLLIALLGDGNAPSLSSSSIFPLCRCAD